jgi:hypothetical protein
MAVYSGCQGNRSRIVHRFQAIDFPNLPTLGFSVKAGAPLVMLLTLILGMVLRGDSDPDADRNHKKHLQMIS